MEIWKGRKEKKIKEKNNNRTVHVGRLTPLSAQRPNACARGPTQGRGADVWDRVVSPHARTLRHSVTSAWVPHVSCPPCPRNPRARFLSCITDSPGSTCLSSTPALTQLADYGGLPPGFSRSARTLPPSAVKWEPSRSPFLLFVLRTTIVAPMCSSPCEKRIGEGRGCFAAAVGDPPLADGKVCGGGGLALLLAVGRVDVAGPLGIRHRDRSNCSSDLGLDIAAWLGLLRAVIRGESAPHFIRSILLCE
jgi:hypothetical protein